MRLTVENVTDVDLGNFNGQNVLFDLKVTEANDGSFDVEIQSSYGLGGTFRCDSIRKA